MRLLLDTHVFLWFIANDRRLPAHIQSLIKDTSNEVFLSTASIWECAIKYTIGTLSLPVPPSSYLPSQRAAHGITPLLIDDGAIRHLESLPPHHRDPFDRMLISQALQHDLVVVTSDRAFGAYSVKSLGT